MARRAIDRAKEPPSELNLRLSGAGLGCATLIAVYLTGLVPLLFLGFLASLTRTRLRPREELLLTAPFWLLIGSLVAHRLWRSTRAPWRGVGLLLLMIGAAGAVAASPIEPLMGREGAIVLAVIGTSLGAGAALYPRREPPEMAWPVPRRRARPPEAQPVADPQPAGGPARARRRIAHVTLLVPDYDPAIAFFTGPLGFALLEDTDLGDGKRWVLVGPDGREGMCLSLARATTPEQQARIGTQAGDRVGFFLYTDDFARDRARMLEAGVVFEEEPRHEPYGTVAVFRDPFGNRWDLLQPREDPPPDGPPPGDAAPAGPG